MYYGVHFVSAPHKVNPGDQVTVKMVLRAFPKDPCASFQVGKKIFLKEGPLDPSGGHDHPQGGTHKPLEYDT